MRRDPASHAARLAPDLHRANTARSEKGCDIVCHERCLATVQGTRSPRFQHCSSPIGISSRLKPLLCTSRPPRIRSFGMLTPDLVTSNFISSRFLTLQSDSQDPKSGFRQFLPASPKCLGRRHSRLRTQPRRLRKAHMSWATISSAPPLARYLIPRPLGCSLPLQSTAGGAFHEYYCAL